MPSEHACRGFTLVEVLVALAIVALSFMAMFGGIQQIVQVTTLLQDRTFANWVAQNVIVELRLQSVLPEGERIQGEASLGGIDWVYAATFRQTESQAIRQVIVRVWPEGEPERILGLATGVVVQQRAGGYSGFADSGSVLLNSAPDPGLADGGNGNLFPPPEGSVE